MSVIDDFHEVVSFLLFLGFVFLLVVTVGKAVVAWIGPRLLRRAAGRPKPGERPMRTRVRAWGDTLDFRLNWMDDGADGDGDGDGD